MESFASFPLYHLLHHSPNFFSTIFGVAPHNPVAPFTSSGRSLVAAGYSLYSASTELILAFRSNDGSSTIIGFALCDGTFYLSRPHISCPSWGPYYSLNEAREPDWPEGLRQWIQDAKYGRLNHAQKTPNIRHVMSVVCVPMFIERSSKGGGPVIHDLIYDAAPMAFLCEAAGGRGSDGTQDILDIVPRQLHDRVCVFLGSRLDIDRLETYGDVQQGSKKYTN